LTTLAFANVAVIAVMTDHTALICVTLPRCSGGLRPNANPLKAIALAVMLITTAPHALLLLCGVFFAILITSNLTDYETLGGRL
ncbi:hypothetical protein CBR14_22815, partial [Cronobacter sakazakii]